MNTVIALLYTCMFESNTVRIISNDSEYFLLLEFYDPAQTSIGFYNKNGKIGIESFVRARDYFYT